MSFVVFLEWGLVSLLVIFIMDQVVIPLWRDEILFPMFCKSKKQKILDQLEKLEEEMKQREIERKIQEVLATVNTKPLEEKEQDES